MPRPLAFTLVELLVAAAILAILAAIALPNFLHAQTRSKVSRVQAELGTVALGLECYHTDFGRYPPSTLVPQRHRLDKLTSPVAYLTKVPFDLFRLDPATPRPYAYGAMPIDEESRYALASDGPDGVSDHFNIEFYPGAEAQPWENPASGFSWIRYDATNGTISAGDLWRVSDK